MTIALTHALPTHEAMSATSPILFYDGTCGFCATTVQFILKHERQRQSLRFATLQGPLAAEIKTRHPRLATIDSVVWYQPAEGTAQERVLVRSSAGLAVARYLGGIWKFLAVLGWCVPKPLRDIAYRLIAKHRHKLVRNPTCLLPTPEQRARFIDD
jgi:predicted DCC family thiol-disulfide oxidoreductase YuxK